MVERMGDDTRGTHGLRWAAATALAAVGATFVYDRIKAKLPLDKAEAEQEIFGSSVGRGTPSDGPSRSARKAGYETSDANVRSLVITMIVSVIVIASGLTAVFFMFGYFQSTQQAPNATLTAQQRAPIEPPLPHLQAAPYHDIDAVLLEQSRRLTTYGWNESEHTTAHIPIERAMQQVTGRSLDASAEADASAAPGTTQSFQDNPAFNALDPQHKAPIRVQGEGRPLNVAPSYTPKPEPKR